MAPLYIPPNAEPASSDSFIVVLKDHVGEEQAKEHHQWAVSLLSKRHEKRDNIIEYLDASVQAGIQHMYSLPGFQGYAGRFTHDELEHIRHSPDVAYVEKDTKVYASELQRNAPWGLSRISRREPLSLRTFSKYEHDPQGGLGVKVYVIDTGVNIHHNDFDGRATWGITIPDGDDDNDHHGHGSHCAGTIAGRRYGVAKQALPVAVKVLGSNGSGTTSWVLAGINWVTEQHQSDKVTAKQQGRRYKGAVANLSLGGGSSRALDHAVNNAVRQGVVMTVAAGNDNRDACDYSPARAELAITVGASNLRDERASFSNIGECVDVFAPGENIPSVWIGSNFASQTLSGTSMAAPHVSGLAAYILGRIPDDKEVDPVMIKEAIIRLSTPNVLTQLPDKTPNRLVYNDLSSLSLF